MLSTYYSLLSPTNTTEFITTEIKMVELQTAGVLNLGDIHVETSTNLFTMMHLGLCLRIVWNLKTQTVGTNTLEFHFYMIGRFITCSTDIAAVLINIRRAPHMLTYYEIETVKEMLLVLRPIEVATKELCGQNYITAICIIKTKITEIKINNCYDSNISNSSKRVSIDNDSEHADSLWSVFNKLVTKKKATQNSKQKEDQPNISLSDDTLKYWDVVGNTLQLKVAKIPSRSYPMEIGSEAIIDSSSPIS
ncbi:zinc finger BED domain-containing protein 1 [Aphis craccivora]|uniref:Zinc finger BED domain-containing protein 1 n=1 Tax=Aphis craccivora TaxID=307492 RepID=A0A6G0XZV5_APHCR|nr:zinc finger BED domain-containing protein 1 [Aphis craccivora]